MLKKLSIFVACLIFAQTASAKIIFAPAVSYLEQETDDGTTSSDVKLTVIDIRLGYVFDFGLYLGGLYSIQDQDIFTPDSSDSLFGPSVGFYRGGFLAALTYMIYGEKDFTNGSAKLANVSGFQLDVAYTLPITEGIRLGPQLTYQSLNYAESQVNGVAQEADVDFSGITPAFTLLFDF